MRILFDGWPLIHDPASPAALHLAALLATCPPEVESGVALPSAQPAESGEPDLEWIQARVARLHLSTPTSPRGRLSWEQAHLPRLAQQFQAGWIHTCQLSLPWLPGAAVSASPAGWRLEHFGQVTNLSAPTGVIERLRQSLGWGGLSRARAVLWPSDLPQPATSLAIAPCSPAGAPAVLQWCSAGVFFWYSRKFLSVSRPIGSGRDRAAAGSLELGCRTAGRGFLPVDLWRAGCSETHDRRTGWSGRAGRQPPPGSSTLSASACCPVSCLQRVVPNGAGFALGRPHPACPGMRENGSSFRWRMAGGTGRPGCLPGR
jgi:hypothetical protein